MKLPTLEQLESYRGQWVALNVSGNIICNGETAIDVLSQLRVGRRLAVSMFQVPEDLPKSGNIQEYISYSIGNILSVYCPTCLVRAGYNCRTASSQSLQPNKVHAGRRRIYYNKLIDKIKVRDPLES